MNEFLVVMQFVMLLKTVRRKGWKYTPGPDEQEYKVRNVKDPESTADHSFGVACLAMFIAKFLILI